MLRLRIANFMVDGLAKLGHATLSPQVWHNDQASSPYVSSALHLVVIFLFFVHLYCIEKKKTLCLEDRRIL